MKNSRKAMKPWRGWCLVCNGEKQSRMLESCRPFTSMTIDVAGGWRWARVEVREVRPRRKGSR